MLQNSASCTDSLSQVAHPFLNPCLSTLQDENFVYVVSKFPAGGEIFAHLSAAGFFSEEVFESSFIILRLNQLSSSIICGHL
jgi:hypothetical protein